MALPTKATIRKMKKLGASKIDILYFYSKEGKKYREVAENIDFEVYTNGGDMNGGISTTFPEFRSTWSAGDSAGDWSYMLDWGQILEIRVHNTHKLIYKKLK